MDAAATLYFRDGGDAIKPIVVISKCLEFEPCRYNGLIRESAAVRELMRHVHFVPICPEVAIGLGIPRDPIRIVFRQDDSVRLIQSSSGGDFTEPMNLFVDDFLRNLASVDGFILKSRSPSCGLWETAIYSGAAVEEPVEKGAGLFGGAILERFPGLPAETEESLANPDCFERFLSRVFLSAKKRGHDARL